MLGLHLWDWCLDPLAASAALPGAGLTEVTSPLPQLAAGNRPVRSTLKMRGNLAVKATSVTQ